jgi:hypothetical protein
MIILNIIKTMQTQKTIVGLVGSLLAIYRKQAIPFTYMIEVRYQADSVLRTFNKFSNVKQGLESARWCWDIGFSSRNRNTHGQTLFTW